MANPPGHSKDKLRVLVIEPYWAGSHRSVWELLSDSLPFEFRFLTLPGRKWKWRMRLAAPFFARELERSGERFDRIVASTFLDAAAFRGLAPAWVRDVPLLAYFHENQFAYPVQVEDERDLHFGLTNLTTAMAADSLAFNSGYNLESFLEGARKLLKASTDMPLNAGLEEVRNKARVLPPPLDFSIIDRAREEVEEEVEEGGPPVVLWNHRWEHDKNPEECFGVLERLALRGVDFRLAVLGENFERRPEIFDRLGEIFGERLLALGYVEGRREYARWLARADLAVSTAGHEFFGLAVIEALRGGARPLLPERLSYPELFGGRFLYAENRFEESLGEELRRPRGLRIPLDEARRLTAPYDIKTLLPKYESWILEPEKGGAGKGGV